MTPSEQVKAEGLKSLSDVARLNQVRRATLSDWAKDRPELFKTILAGTKVRFSR